MKPTPVVTIESVCQRWKSADRPLFKGKLIDENGCCCAQGDVLRCSGVSDEELRRMKQSDADIRTAKLLGISRAQAVLLRNINDMVGGCPQDVLEHPENILGPEWTLIDKFWWHIDMMTTNDWLKVAAAWTAAGDMMLAAATAVRAAVVEDVACIDAMRTAIRGVAGNAAGATVGSVAGAACIYAIYEIMDRTNLTKFVFLPLFGFENPEALAEKEKK